MSKLKLEVGKAYRTRKGHKAVVVDMEKGDYTYPVTVAIKIKSVAHSQEWKVRYLRLNGCMFSDGSESDYDLVGEWVEELDFDWNCLPAWADKAIAMDSNGKWFCYASKPIIVLGDYWWDSVDDDTTACDFIPPEYEPKNFNGSWEGSLFINPKYQEGEQ